MKILLIKGPNLNMLGLREPDVYGDLSLDSIVAHLQEKATTLGVEVEAFQSNSEGELISRIQDARGRYDGMIFNPGGYTHTSVALRDAILASELPCVEVHLSNLYKRESFRHTSLTAGACIGVISGFGATGYTLALEALLENQS
jgi:3-dehydroquinate dehydratase-2